MLGHLFHELNRRGVLRAAVAYAVGAWALIEGSGVLAEAFDAPDTIVLIVIVVLSIGFPFAIAFSWFFDITPDGIRRTQTLDDVAPRTAVDRRINFAIISLLVAALALSIYGNLQDTPAPPQSVSILISDFQNDADNDLFSGIVEESLRVGLEVAPFVSTFSRQRATALAREIAGDDDAPLTSELAGLVALREGINTVVGGRVSREGRQLIVTASGYAPGDQTQLFTVTERASSDNDILSVLASVAKKLRIALGDTPAPAGTGGAESFVVANLEAASAYLKAQDLQFDRQLEEAIPYYEEAIELDPNFARAYAGLALTEDYLGRTESATTHWERALAGLDTLTERGQLRTLGTYYVVNQQDYDKALETFERLIERYPADNVAHNNLAVAAFYAMDFQRALEVGREVARRYPDRSAYAANLALYAMYANRFDEASDVARGVIEINSVNAYAHFVTAQTQAVAGDLDAAVATYEQMSGMDQFAQAVGAEGIADVALYRGDAATALAALDTAIARETSIGQTNAVALKHVMRIDAFLLNDDFAQAIAAADAAVELGGSNPAVLVPAALAYISTTEFDKAQTVIDSLSDGFSKPRRAYAQALRARMLSAQGDIDAAVAAADAAIELTDLWLIRLIRAEILLEAGRAADAQSDLEACATRKGEGIAVFLNDRPSLRMLRKLESVQAKANGTSQPTASTPPP